MSESRLEPVVAKADRRFPRLSRDARAWVLGAIVLIGGVALLWFVRQVVGATASGVLIAVLVLPTVAYLVISDRLSEISGPGGLSAKFREPTATSATGALQPVAADDPWAVQKAELSELVRIASRLPVDRPIVLTFTLPGTAYQSWAIKEYIDALEVSRGRGLVAFQDTDAKLLGYMPTDRFRVLIQSTGGAEFVNHLNQPDAIAWLATAPGVLTERCSSTATNRDALTRMKEARLDQLVIVDEAGRLQRVVERDQLVAAILLAAS